MLVLDGSPGAGKTTMLGHLLESLPDKLIVFPEAQPPPALCGDAQVARALLAEDRARIESAAHLHALHPALQVASDRCHVGVLAYRYALVQHCINPLGVGRGVRVGEVGTEVWLRVWCGVGGGLRCRVVVVFSRGGR